MAKGQLTQRQRKFCEHYIACGHQEEAALAAGFTKKYAASAYRQPAVQAYLAELRKSMPAAHTEVINFLTGVMRGTIKTSDLRTEAAYQMGKRAGLWKNHIEYETRIKEAAKHE